MKNPILRSKTQKFRGRKKNLLLKFQMYLKCLKVRQKNYLRPLLPKGDLLGIEKLFKKQRSIELLSEPSEKA